ncbi:MAG TPA: DUF1810 domain-containing protein [Alphaproteobacteria bacterium]|nr:DUF1810 domain-containing protein [Alphaproteobacteria bacterium]
MSDPHTLQRFVDAQAPVYAQVRAELRDGRKRSHWMWFVFPQIKGLGVSPTAQFYAIASRGEAEAYLAHPVLGPRLTECTQLVLDVAGRSAHDIFGSPDDLKFRSSMTLFADVTADNALFRAALRRYFNGEPDRRTIEILAQGGS